MAAPKTESSSVLYRMYALAGAVAGAVEGVAKYSINHITAIREQTGKRIQGALVGAQVATEESALQAAQQAYLSAGAAAGIVAGGKYAMLTLWWHLTEDDIKMRLLQASPVKYRLKDLDFHNGVAGSRLPQSRGGHIDNQARSVAPGGDPSSVLISEHKAALMSKEASYSYSSTHSSPLSSSTDCVELPQRCADHVGDATSPRVLA